MRRGPTELAPPQAGLIDTLGIDLTDRELDDHRQFAS
jgi:hypothetical protein